MFHEWRRSSWILDYRCLKICNLTFCFSSYPDKVKSITISLWASASYGTVKSTHAGLHWHTCMRCLLHFCRSARNSSSFTSRSSSSSSSSRLRLDCRRCEHFREWRPSLVESDRSTSLLTPSCSQHTLTIQTSYHVYNCYNPEMTTITYVYRFASIQQTVTMATRSAMTGKGRPILSPANISELSVFVRNCVL